MANLELWGTIAFYLCLLALVYVYRKRFSIQNRIIALYRTRIGIRFIDYVAERFPRVVRFFGYSSLVAGILGMPFVIFLMVNNVIFIIEKQFSYDGNPLILPGTTIAGLGVRFPLIIGWICIFILMVVHEFSHGVVAKAHGIRIKSTGVVFLGPILGAFVEPDEKEMKKAKKRSQLSVLAAGPFSNIILFLVVVSLSKFMIWPALMATSDSVGVMVSAIPNASASAAGLEGRFLMTGMNGTDIRSIGNITDSLKGASPGGIVVMDTS